MRSGVLAAGAVAVLAVGLAVTPAPACGYGDPSEAMKLIRADVVVAARVLGTEDDPIELSLRPGAPAVRLTVAVLEITRRVKGADDYKTLRLAMLTHQRVANGEEALFYLTRHPTEPVFLQAGRFDYPMLKRDNGAEFERLVTLYRHWAQLLADPRTGLESTKAEDRALTAELLLAERFGRQRPASPSQPLTPELTRKVLLALADADWSKADDFELAPELLFNRLPGKDRAGFQPLSQPGTPEYRLEAKAWLREFADTFQF